jgi:predicted DNA-binding protein
VNGQRRKIADWLPPEGMLERLQAAADENQRRLSAELTVAVEHYLDELERLEDGSSPN